ncbi:hypothetical protein F4553_007620 [Allocatelliglobosispora scoriae]|uniref:Uncharacterized protein n=1 Tax=Allocatelliglobosispora scoriae TaxID=643052 RepID=A0A841C2R1_9ACTN|nr:hypothetical protein [Allocatelliglobosispora scoriae]MBB5874186.1 hypothetical protein [Allocatelliglobosispora scoriae]
MRTARFISFALDVLSVAEGQGEIVKVEPYEKPGTNAKPCGIKVTTTGGVLYLKVVRTTSPGGDKFDEPEQLPYPDYPVPTENLREQASTL